MCGFAALFCASGAVPDGAIQAMTGLIRHRGPDGEGYAFFGKENVVLRGGPDTPPDFREKTPERYAPRDLAPLSRASAAFGHRRLAIIDLSPSGHQPMCDAGGRYWITYNGEIYNYPELRAELEALGTRFVSNSDTEVLLAAFARWGVKSLERFNGMFAFILYDRVERRIFAVRDRFGVKPLYWWQGPDGLLAFASEIKQFTCLPGWSAKLNGQRAYDFLNWGVADHTNETLFAGVNQIPGGHYIELDASQCGGRVQTRQWFKLAPPARLDIDFAQAADGFRDRFMTSIKLRLRADVPVGTGLSGGLDSSSILCAVGKLLGADERAHHNSFSARSDDPAYDEGEFIEEVVSRTGVRHHEVRPEAGEALAGLAELTWYQDEPFGAASVFAQWRVFALAAKAGVKVTLDGHGSDEYLAGYHTVFASRLRELAASGRLIAAFREYTAMRARHGISAGFLIGHLIDGGAPYWLRNLLRHARGLTVFDPAWLSLEVLGATPRDPCADAPGGMANVTDYSIRHLSAYGLPHMLHWSDRSSMAVSVESREPFLDHHLVQYALSLPSRHKVSAGVTKRVLRSGLGDILPEMISNRVDKKGFITPEQRWVTRDRRAEFLAALRDAIASCDGILTEAARAKFEAMIEGQAPYHSSLWRVISFAAWMKRFSVRVP